jgi:hypothetical protein
MYCNAQCRYAEFRYAECRGAWERKPGTASRKMSMGEVFFEEISWRP